MRVALCLFGQPRFVDNPHGFDSHFNNIISKYDWVIISRYDNYIYNMPNLNELHPDELYLSTQHSHFVDVLMFGGQSQIESMICDDDSTIEYLCNHINNFTPEEFKRVAFNRYYKAECRTNIGVGILRSLTLDGLQK